jgi:hypothetical protein
LIKYLIKGVTLYQQNRLLPYLGKFYTFFLKIRKKGLLFNIVLEINKIIVHDSSLILISHINEQLTDIIQHPYFKKYLAKIALFYMLNKQGRSNEEIIQMIEPQFRNALKLNLSMNSFAGNKKF